LHVQPVDHVAVPEEKSHVRSRGELERDVEIAERVRFDAVDVQQPGAGADADLIFVCSVGCELVLQRVPDVTGDAEQVAPEIILPETFCTAPARLLAKGSHGCRR